MAGTKGMSWKWRLTILFIFLFIFSLGFLFSSYGNQQMVKWAKTAYNDTPPEERIAMSTADYYLQLAWFQGWICGNERIAMQMFEEFLGIAPGPNGEFFKTLDSYGPQWNGFFDPKTKTGWGILHPRAPEAYYYYLELYDANNSIQMTTARAVCYHTLFYNWYPILEKSAGGKPHPKFYVYWQKIRDQKIKIRYLQGGMPFVTPKPPEFEGPAP